MKLLLSIIVFLMAAAPAYADDSSAAVFDTPQMVTIRGYQDDAMEPFLSRDGTILFFNNLNEPSVNTDIHYAIKIDPLTFEYKGRVGGVNTERLEGVAAMDRKANFYFVSTRDFDKTGSTIFTGRFQNGRVTDIRHVQGNLSPNKWFWFNMDVEVSADGQTLYSTDNHTPLFSRIPDTSNFFIAAKSGEGVFMRDPKSDEIMKNINAPNVLQYAAGISGDDLSLYFTRLDLHKKEIGIYVAIRQSKATPFGVPHRIEAIQGFVEAPTVNPDNSAIYFHKKIDGHYRIFLAKKTAARSKK